MQIYRLNMISDKSYRKFLTLVGIHDHTEAASGGEETEKLEEAIIRARKDMKTVYRAVTSADYEHLAMNTPEVEVARAKAVPRYHPSQDSEVPDIVTVVVVPESKIPRTELEPGTSFLKTVYRHLDEHRLLTTELFVMSPEYVEVSVQATVVIKSKNEPGRVKKDIEKKLRYFLDPISGGVGEKGWPFGRPVYISEIYEIIDGVDGVDYVTTILLKRKGEDQPGDILISPHSLIFHSIDHPSVITIEKGASHE
jgi:predicted phage baseplate assembly protein